MKVNIKVLATDILAVEYSDIHDCPIARAFKRVINSEYDIRVGGSIAHIYNNSEIDVYSHLLGKEGIEIQNQYGNKDNGKKVKGFTFKADIPKECLK